MPRVGIAGVGQLPFKTRYADVGVYGAQGFTTPNLDRLASEGIRFTDFHVAQGVCSASRAALIFLKL